MKRPSRHTTIALLVLLAAAVYVWRRQNAALDDVTGPIATDTGYLPGPLLSTPLVAEGGTLPAGSAPAPGAAPQPGSDTTRTAAGAPLSTGTGTTTAAGAGSVHIVPNPSITPSARLTLPDLKSLFQKTYPARALPSDTSLTSYYRSHSAYIDALAAKQHIGAAT